jgi:H+-transporting ATPase
MNKHADDYARQPVGETLRELRTDRGQGLASAEASRRIEHFGYNGLSEKEEPLWHRIFRRLWAPIPWMIEAAAILSAVARKWEDFVIILLMLAVNGGLDFFQERRALNALKALRRRLSAEVIVLPMGDSPPSRHAS